MLVNNTIVSIHNESEENFLNNLSWKNIPKEEDYIIDISEEVKTYFSNILIQLDITSESIYQDFLQLSISYESSCPEWVLSWFRSLKNKLTCSPLFFLLRWTNKLRLSPLEQKIFYLWVSEHFWRMDYNKWPFYEVYDRWGSYNKHQRYSDTRLSLGYHTDSTQKDNLPRYIWLLCFEQSNTWWESKILNMSNVYQTMLNQYPEELKILHTEYLRDSSSNENEYPIFQWINWRLVFRYMRRWIEIGYESSGMTLSTEKKEAMDALEDCMRQNPFALEFKMQVGDILLFDNTILAHDRTEFKDDGISKRLLIRTWIYSAI